MSADPDIELVEATLDGDDKAFEELVSRHQRSIFSLILRMCSNPDEAPDIAQQVFLRAHTKLHTFRRRARFKTWLYTIAINLCRNELRHRKRWGPMEQVEVVNLGVTADLDKGLINEERKRRLAVAIEQLPHKQKTVLILRIYEEMSYQEIAEAIGASENSAKVNFHHAVKKLQDELREV